MSKAILLIASLLLCAVACAGTDPDRVALEAAIHRWMTAVNAQDVATLSATMTEDVELLDHSVTVKGRDAAIRALREAAARGRLVATTREITIAHDVAWHVVGLAQNQKDVVHARGQALEVWRRVNGKWQLHRRMAAQPLSSEVSLTRPSTKEPVLDQAPREGVPP